ncbi:TetR/AcrR family transcriptional regulator [Streptomyces sp. S.PNR 29]|uniref:TetR/AcrR family transcriptional regulator n=1 Tax=Streptomyces sp. S.PNR 29 TaxID=2973805 RepID=UPI0025AFFF79|nr:TetR/AcrR family transcriptional regulator [Streptomyces sp. S.PNR 29]MDN0193477.1 TetR/AcrR family transcriptional regulator [Streptomyces sp. S.PNR 29]
MAKQERARRTREKVLDAAAEEFAAQGYDRATLNDVARRTGMTKGALYGHFPSKEILAATLLAQSREVWEEMRLARDVPGAAARTVLEGLVLELARRLRSDIRLRAALRLATDLPCLARATPDLFDDVRRYLVHLVRRAQEEGGMAPYPPELVAELLLTSMHGALHASQCDDKHGSAPTGEAVWRLLLDALAGERGGDGDMAGR